MEDMIEQLMDPSCWPEQTECVSLVQTHISWVLIGDRIVFKIKKPVDFGFLDFSTLEKRMHYCHREVELNRRLSPDIYLDVVPIRRHRGCYRIDSQEGEVVEYAVKMRRIPQERIMKNLYCCGGHQREHLEMVARRLATFHRSARSSLHISSFGSAERFKVNTDENFQQTQPYINVTIPAEVFEGLRAWTESFFEEKEALFERRVTQGSIRDCHGDLHMEHICIDEEIQIFDCIEFNDRFRYSDTLCDIAFLIMDLEFHGGWEEASILWRSYSELMGEGDDALSLLNFYKVYRAYVRGKIYSFQVSDPNMSPQQRDEVKRRAASYFNLAWNYIQR
jgi:hypothetical protein